MMTSALPPQYSPESQQQDTHQQYQHRPSAGDIGEGLTVHSNIGDDIRVNAIAPSASSQTLRRGPWAPEEDRKLIESINLFGPTNWVRISQSLGTRTPKQCRERYHQNLKPSLNRNPISPEEGRLIEELVAKHGKRWAEIARHLNGRSDNAIKNWWNGGTNRRRRASSQAILTDHQHDQYIQPLTDYHIPHQQLMSYPPPPSGPHPHYAPQHMSQQQPAFNTAIFQSPLPQQQPQRLPIQQQQQQQQPMVSLPPHQPLPPTTIPQQQQVLPPLTMSRPSSITQEIFTQHTGVKRFLEEQHQPARRHSAQTILTSTGGSSSPFSRGGSSRNSSISFDWNSSATINSQGDSRRSSLAHELFPNALGNQSKRQNSYCSSTYLSPNIQSQRGSTSGIVPLHMTITPPTAAISQSNEKPLFKSEFSFNNKEGVKLPPPSSIPLNPAFTPSAMLNRVTSDSKKDEEELESSESEKGVMNISNLLT